MTTIGDTIEVTSVSYSGGTLAEITGYDEHGNELLIYGDARPAAVIADALRWDEEPVYASVPDVGVIIVNAAPIKEESNA